MTQNRVNGGRAAQVARLERAVRLVQLGFDPDARNPGSQFMRMPEHRVRLINAGMGAYHGTLHDLMGEPLRKEQKAAVKTAIATVSALVRDSFEPQLMQRMW